MTLRRCILFVIISFFLSLTVAQAKPTKHQPSKPLLTYAEYMAHYCKKGCVDEGDLLKSVTEVSNELDIDFRDLLAIVKVESKFQSKAKSGRNAGLFQVNLKYHRKKFKGKNPFNVEANTQVGASIYKECLVRHGGNKQKSQRCYNGYGDKRYANKMLEAYRDVLKYFPLEPQNAEVSQLENKEAL